MRCISCDREIPEGSVVCPFCTVEQPGASEQATSLEAPGPDEAATSLEVPSSAPTSASTSASSEAPTSAGSGPTSSSRADSSGGHHGRFLPGTVVAGRYRMVGLLGRGGMGEVYRADDLKLGQQVALKFLPGRMVEGDESVQRLFDEVRMARKVSHANVCRVFDVGETDGQHYVSMEYVDGEDLASLLRRIGRLPEDKAVEIARQLCAALAAAHEEGVLHRDLKPANIMLDGRGRVRLTDFGLAAVAEVRSGTPVYMAPEQLAGQEVSIRSDLYSLGLVLHELFTGRRVFEATSFDELSKLHAGTLSTSLPSISQLDPSVDRVIHRCLEREPGKRPASALAVAAGLPGADPLAAALAAGETPSPEMVAEAGGEGRLSLAVAAPLLLFTLVGAIAVGALQGRLGLGGWVPLELPPAVLDARAQEIVAALGYDEPPGDTAYGLAPDLTYLSWVRREGSTAERLEMVAEGRTSTVSFWWRSSPTTLVSGGPAGVGIGGAVDIDDPPRTLPGMVSLRLDTRGNLTWLDAVAVRVDPPAPGTTDWPGLFAHMGLEIDDFTPVLPRVSPEHFADERAAWEGSVPGHPDVPLRIEAAALGGRPVSVRTFGPAEPLQPAAAPAASSGGFGLVAAVAIFILSTTIGSLLVAIFGGLYVARRNVRNGRGDARGARRIGFGLALVLGVSWLLSEHSYSAADINEFIQMLIFVGAVGGLTWALYLAVEPFMRRHSPETLIGWTRFIDGRLSDPLVARDVLLGCAAAALARLLDLVPAALSARVETAGNYLGLPMESVPDLVSEVVGNATIFALLALGLSFLYGLTYVATGRRAWVAYAAWLLLLAGPGFIGGLTINGVRPSATWITAIFWGLGWALWLYVLFYRGILVFLVMTTAGLLLSLALPTLDLAAWYSETIVAGLGLFAALSIYAFVRCVPWKGALADSLVGD